MPNKQQVVGIVGNPNSGKSSLFNQLTGLRQRVGNYPGVTVDKKSGPCRLPSGETVRLIDYPGAYSVYPNSSDERIVIQVLSDPSDANYPDAIIYVADVNALERHLLLASQIIDLGIPMIFVLNMVDIAREQGTSYDAAYLEERLNVPVIPINSRSGTNLLTLKRKLADHLNTPTDRRGAFYTLSKSEQNVAQAIRSKRQMSNDYRALLLAHHHTWLPTLSDPDRQQIAAIANTHGFEPIRQQIQETLRRFNEITPIANKTIHQTSQSGVSQTDRIDAFLTNRWLGPLIFFAIMLLVFQAIYAWSEYPMLWIESGFEWLGLAVRSVLPSSWFTDLIVDGIVAGLGGVLVFIPQIAILFLLISILEEVGYMSRAAFMFDRIMQRFGLNGRSVVALVSSGACAIPAIMSTRTIANWKERLITIMVSPLISCSARIPVYAILIGFVVSADIRWGPFNAQGLAFMGLYVLGVVAALGSALVFKWILRSDEPSTLMMELPLYKPPVWTNILLNVKEKVLTFIIEAGKVILLISIVLWFLASYGPSQKMRLAEQSATESATALQLSDIEKENLIAARKIEASYAGHIGKWIEPVIEPLGFDWKMGIALITSFAAREVFVGTMATIYSVGSADDEATLRTQMAREVHADSGRPVYTLATALSLLIFYVFAMQCMSTLAVTKRETKSWKWPIIQFTFMGVMAYIGSWIVYQALA